MSWNGDILQGTKIGGNYANPDDIRLQDKDWPRDEFGFRIEQDSLFNKGNNSGVGDVFSIEKYLDTSGSGFSYQEVSFNTDDVGTYITNTGSSVGLNDDGYITIGRNGIYLINTSAQNVKDGEFVVARLYDGPVGWYIKRLGEEATWSTNPHMNMGESSLGFVISLQKGDVLVPLCGTNNSVGLSGTFWFSVTKLV